MIFVIRVRGISAGRGEDNPLCIVHPVFAGPPDLRSVLELLLLSPTISSRDDLRKVSTWQGKPCSYKITEV